MKKNPKKKTKEKTKEKMSRKKVLLIFVCIFLALLVIFGATLAIILGVRNANSSAYLEDVRLDEGECNYFATAYKYEFIQKHKENGAEDTQEFWNSKNKNGVTYAKLLSDGTIRYIRGIVVSNYLFNTYCEFSKQDEITVKKAVKKTLEHKADNSTEKFNELAAPSGFDYEDFESCAELLYKALTLKDRVVGLKGENIQSLLSTSAAAEITGYLDNQLSNYSHVKLLFIRTEDTLRLDQNANHVVDPITGEPEYVSLSEEEKVKRQQLISDIRASIAAYNEGSGKNEMTPSYFNTLLTEHGSDGDPEMNADGYYFLPVSDYTVEYASGADYLSDVVDRSMDMSVGSYAEVTFDGGVCFIYKEENKAHAYLYGSACFSDFYEIAAGPVFASFTEAYLEDVTVKDELLSTDFTKLSYNHMFIPTFK